MELDLISETKVPIREAVNNWEGTTFDPSSHMLDGSTAFAGSAGISPASQKSRGWSPCEEVAPL